MTPSGGSTERRIRFFGDCAVVAETSSVAEAHGLARAVSARRWPGVEDVIVGYRSVSVVVDPTIADPCALGPELAGMAAAPDPRAQGPRHVVDVPVVFDGPDLDEVGRLARLSPQAVVRRLESARLEVAFVGFLPGFAYLHGLPPELAAVARRHTPRPSVPAGSVALGGGFAGVYPQASPGGWQVVGHTGVRLFDPDTPPFATLGPGDVVRLRAADDATVPTRRPRRTLRAPATAAGRSATVRHAGLLSTVQDLGRVGVAALGVPRAGGADPFMVRTANRLMGNDDGAAVIEVTAQGPTISFDCAAHVAVVGGAAVSLDGRPVPADTVIPVAPGQVLSVGTTHEALRAYVAVAGGVDIDAVLGSRSSDMLTGLGAGPLRPGDVLGIGAPTRPRGRIVPLGLGGDRVRVVAGPDDVDPDALEGLVSGPWQVGPASDRMGVRLARPEGPGIAPPAGGIASRGLVTGAVQVTPDGRPVVMLCDHATVGGYPVVATVISADVGVLARCRPGDDVRFELVAQREARAARTAAERALAAAVTGWYPVRTA